MSLIKSISGIRGTLGGKVGDALTPIDIVKFTSAFGSWVLQTSKIEKIVIGRDARQSGEMVSNLVAGTLQGLGIDVVDLGLASTPTVEMAVVMEEAGGGIIISASHNPVQWNALKFVNAQGEFLSAEDGEKILEIAEKEDFEFAKVGALGKYRKDDTYLQKHIEAILKLPLVDKAAIEQRDFYIVVDAVNSVGGIAIPALLKALGVKKIHELFCEPNGQFPHNPEPLPEHLNLICSEIEDGDYDLGIVVDPDADRLAFICEDGTPFGEEYTLVSVADYVLQNKTGNTVSNLSSTRALQDVTLKRGGNYIAAAVGEVNVVTAMKANSAVIGGEGNGGIILPELHYGRDALVGVALFLTYLAKSGKSAKMLRATYPSYHISKNKIELTPDINVDLILEKIKERYQKQPINSIDGVKIEFEREWVHLRKSNTEPIIRIYAESESQVTADALARKIIMDIKEVITEK
ncbi:phosphoglucosamine mutase [Thermoflexibacter ruber]|uniref:Phosphomannomutase n=1 Tax=Thermoflexibacter ruber TaxID=1003 RepID=A0A1I2GNF9_9BACT|nr:phosphoglucosamine mutase [Thermoflexibacter ruber]SFF18808.1 phosphomannomutase [Thermoflexibacter ruber]